MVSGVYVATLQGVYSGVMMMRMPAGGGGGGAGSLDPVPLWTRRRIHGRDTRYTTVYSDTAG